MPSSEFSPLFRFQHAKTTGEYDAVLRLRHLAYAHAGKVSREGPVEAMGDAFDAESTIFLAYDAGKLVATMRAFLTRNGQPFDHGRYAKFPDDFPPLDRCVEASRLAVDLDFQGKGLLAAMVTELAAFALSQRRRYLFGGAAGALIEIYRRYGAQVVGEPYCNPALSNLEHRIIVMDLEKLVHARQGITQDIWMRLYCDLAKRFAPLA